MTGLVKICGLKSIDQALAAVEAGADLIGFNFAASKRRVDPAVAREALAAARSMRPSIRACGLFVDADASEIEQVLNQVEFDFIQPHGMNATIVALQTGMPTILPIRFEPGISMEAAIELVLASKTGSVEFIMLDGYHPTLHGGTGVRADWDLAEQLARLVPLMLAGGLNPENVGDAIAAVQPAVVDVASGVETDGIKDPAKMSAFVRRARAAFDQSISSGTSSQDAP